MQEEIITTTNTEICSSVPFRKMSYYTGSIPKLIIPASKYSSTETELSTDYEDGSSNDNVGRLSLSGVSTSAASLSGSSHQRKRRRRRRTTSSRISVGSINSGGSSIGHGSYQKSENNGKSAESSWTMNRKQRMETFLVLNSVRDLKNAVGRHRGVSGTSSPAVDVTLFSMFYLTDAFDDLLVDGLSHRMVHSQCQTNLHNNCGLKQDLLTLLRKQIVYSLRMNYFCPASKVAKLVQLVEEYHPLEQTQGLTNKHSQPIVGCPINPDFLIVYADPADFLDLLFRKILKPAPFLTYANGALGFIHHIPLEHYLERKHSHFQPAALTIQQLLRQTGLFSTTGSKKYKRFEHSSILFSTVPYPVLILKVSRRDASEETVGNEPKSIWRQSPDFYQHQTKPVIPNMKIDITDLIARKDTRDNIPGSGNWDKTLLRKNQSNQENSLHCDFTDAVDQGTSESRFFKGLKSVYKAMFRYLEDFTSFSAHISPHESPSVVEDARINNHFTSHPPPRINHMDDVTEEIDSFSKGKTYHLLSSSTPSLVSCQSSPHSVSGRGHSCKQDFDQSFTTGSHQIQVKMELMAVICKSRKKNSVTVQREKGQSNITSFSGYSVYCKAGNDVEITGEKPQHAPWVFHQSRNGVVPQVVLIENFGKWIDSLERHHENFNLYEVPMEIRRVLEDSHLFIYKRLET